MPAFLVSVPGRGDNLVVREVGAFRLLLLDFILGTLLARLRMFLSFLLSFMT